MADRPRAPASRLEPLTAPLRRELLGPLRALVRRALVAAALAGVLGALGGTMVAARQPDAYTARATFTLVAHSTAVSPLSTNRSLLAEQNARHLRSGRAARIARDAAGGATFRGEWVVGPGHGQLSYQVTSDDPALATRVARAVFARAGFLGTELSADPATAPALDLETVSPAAPVRRPTAVVVAAGGLLGAVAGFFLILLVAVRPGPPADVRPGPPTDVRPRPATTAPPR